MLQLRFHEAAGTADYRWKGDEAGFGMPVRVARDGYWRRVVPTPSWQTMTIPVARRDFGVDLEQFCAGVETVGRAD